MRKDVNLKKLLTKNGHIEKIVALPKKIFSFTGIAVNLIVINKSSNEDQQVEFIDASEKFTLKDKKTRVLDVKGIFVLLSEENSNLKKSISFQEIVKNRYNLSVNRYVFDELNLLSEENQSLVALNNFVSQLPRTSIRPSNDIRVVRTRDLSDNSLKSIKSFEDVEKRKPNQRVSLLEDNALLLATTWKSLKPTLYRKRDEDIYYEPNLIFALSVDESKIDLDYLILELKKDYVQKQLERKSVGTGIMRINRRDLLQIKIVVPNRNEQEKRKLNFKQSIILEQQQKLESLKEELGINIADENSFLRHKISGTLNNVRGSFNKLKEIIDNQVSKELPEVYSYKAKPTYTANLRDYLNRLNRDINSIHRAVQTVGKELSIREMKFKTFNLIKFIEDYVEEVKNRPNTNYEIWFENDYEALNDNKVKEVNVTGDPDFLYQAFDNIIQNAERHAFSKDDEEEIVEISLFYNFESSEVELHFCNTGNPLPENFSLENFIRKGSKSGTNSGKGIGGWLINEVMKAHEAKLDIIDESEQGTEYAGSMFPTRIKLTFPMEFKI
jgi:type I restriction enzyme M protein